MDAFRHYLTEYLTKSVQLGLGGPEACQGQLVHIGQDYLTLGCIKGIRLHFPLHHIRSVIAVPEAPVAEVPASEEAWPETCTDLLVGLIGQPVLINPTSPEAPVGTLLAATDEFLVLTVEPEDRLCLTRFHLKSFCRYEDGMLEPEGSGTPFSPQQAELEG